MASRHIRLRWAVTAALLTLNCAPIQNRPDRTSVRVDGLYGNAENVHRGCDGELRSEAHRQLGGAVEASHEDARGLLAGGRAWLARGTLEEAAGFDPIGGASPYDLWGAGGWVGWDFASVGVDGGLHVAGAGDATPLLLPYLRMRFGRTETFWLEGAAGPDDPALYVNALSAGVGARNGPLRARAGLTAHGRLILSQEPQGEAPSSSRPELRVAADEGLDPGVYFDVQVDLPGHLGLGAGVLAAPNPAGRLGLIVHW
jgi:hypothetical protein